MPSADQYPSTIEAAVRLLLDLVPAPELEKIAHMAEADLIDMHFGLGQWVRNHFGLWKDNRELLQVTGKRHPDDASAEIIHALWRRLRDDLPKLH